VRDAQAAPGQLGQRDVAGDGDLLGGVGDSGHAEAGRDGALVDDALARKRVVLAVRDDHGVELACVVHDQAHHAGALDALTVV